MAKDLTGVTPDLEPFWCYPVPMEDTLHRALLPLLLLAACHPPATVHLDTGSPSTPWIHGDTAVESVGDTQVPVLPDGESDFIYDPTVLHTFYLELSNDARSTLSRSPYEYVEGDFIYEGVSYGPVGIRLKGSGTFEPINEKPSFKVKFGFDGSDTRFFDIHRLTMHNARYDPSVMKEHITLSGFLEAGLPASRTGFARVYLNDDLYGVYVLVESKDELFLKTHYDDPDGNLYEVTSCDVNQSSCFQLDEPGTASPEEEWAAVLEMASAVGYNDATWFEDTQQYFTAEHFQRYIAAEMVYAHWDGYACWNHNYHLYHEPSSGQWTLSPWGQDVALGVLSFSGNNCYDYGAYYPMDTYDGGILSEYCLRDPDCSQGLYDQVEALIEQFETRDLPAYMDDLRLLLEDAILEPSHSDFNAADFNQFFECQQSWLADRPAFARAELESLKREYGAGAR